jgi:hypothetical protein
MNRTYIPTKRAEDWKHLLADPEKHWRTGYSAKALAYCWEGADGFPPEISRLFGESNIPAFQHVDLLLALPEYKVALPGGGHASQNDLFVLAKAADGNLISMMVEGKVSEAFGPTVREWIEEPPSGKTKRLDFIRQRLGLAGVPLDSIRYQLLHRTVSALVEAERFNVRHAVMIVHSFSPSAEHFDDYRAFLALFGVETSPNKLFLLRESEGINLYSGWATGDAKYLTG